ncbi:MAG: sialidase family protein, partial [Candidatus Latescibacterota bacterium]
HPHAGTGFGISQALSHTLDESGRFDYREHNDRYCELFQFAYNGETFTITHKERVHIETLFSECAFSGLALSNAISDGEDLLFCMTAKGDPTAVDGVTRWRKGKCGWRPISFVPVTDNRAGDLGAWVCGGEASMIRDADGSLLFSARSSGAANFDAAVWRSADDGETWKQVIYRKDCRSRSPVSINQAADGTPFVAANLPPLERTREVLCYWPLNETRTDFKECRIARDLPSEFGPAPSGSWWRIDHPTSAIVQLSDGAWHSLLAYRIVDNGEIESDAGPPPQTGCYVEEVFSGGEAIPAWRF